MVSACLPLPRDVADDLLAIAARAVCDRPGESPKQCASRTEQLVHSVMGFGPRDGMEYILATLIFGHYGMILDSMHDVHIGMTASLKVRTKSGIVTMDRAMMEMVRALQTMGVRPTLAEAPRAPAVEDPVAAAVEVLAAAPEALVETQAVKAQGEAPVEAPAAPVTVASPAMPAGQFARAVAPVRAPSRPVAQSLVQPAPGAMLELVRTMGDPALTRHAEAFEKALASVNETLAEAKAEQRGRGNGKAAPGD